VPSGEQPPTFQGKQNKTWPGHGICNKLENHEKKNREEEVSHSSLFGRDTLKKEPEPKSERYCHFTVIFPGPLKFQAQLPRYWDPVSPGSEGHRAK